MSAVSNVSSVWWAHLFGCGMLPLFLFLLLSLCLQLMLHVLDVASKTVAVEVVVTGRFGVTHISFSLSCHHFKARNDLIELYEGV